MEFLVQNFYLHKRIKNTGTTSDLCVQQQQQQLRVKQQQQQHSGARASKIEKINSGYMYK